MRKSVDGGWPYLLEQYAQDVGKQMEKAS